MSELVELPERWAEALTDLRHDVYHTFEWANADALASGARPVAAVARDGDARLVLPLLRRELGGDRWDAASPYGYGGPVFTAGLSGEHRRELFERARAALQRSGCVSAFIRTHPLLDDQDVPGELIVSGLTAAVDLRGTPDERLAAMRKGHRYDIRRARREGVELEIDPPRVGTLDEFHQIYQDTMSRLGADEYYRFDRSYYDALTSPLGDRVVLARARAEGRTQAAALFTLSTSNSCVGYHLSASVPSATSHQPVKFLLAGVMDWSSARGYRWMHLGGGLGAGDDSLRRFKTGFGSSDVEYRAYGVVVDRDEYERRSRDEPSVGPMAFPTYRQDHR